MWSFLSMVDFTIETGIKSYRNKTWTLLRRKSIFREDWNPMSFWTINFKVINFDIFLIKLNSKGNFITKKIRLKSGQKYCLQSFPWSYCLPCLVNGSLVLTGIRNFGLVRIVFPPLTKVSNRHRFEYICRPLSPVCLWWNHIRAKPVLGQG